MQTHIDVVGRTGQRQDNPGGALHQIRGFRREPTFPDARFTTEHQPGFR
jgi:hypothetical protein